MLYPLRRLLERLAERDRHALAQTDDGVAAVPPRVLLGRAPVPLDRVELAVVPAWVDAARGEGGGKGGTCGVGGAHLGRNRQLWPPATTARSSAERSLRKSGCEASRRLQQHELSRCDTERRCRARGPSPQIEGSNGTSVAQPASRSGRRAKAGGFGPPCAASDAHAPRKPLGSPRSASSTSAPLWHPQRRRGTAVPRRSTRGAARPFACACAFVRTLRTKTSCRSEESFRHSASACFRRTAPSVPSGLWFLSHGRRPLKYSVSAAASSADVAGASWCCAGSGAAPTRHTSTCLGRG